MSLIPYITDPASIVLPRWVPLVSGLEILHHPVEDPTGPGLAHLTYRAALEVASASGARLPTRAEVLLLHGVASTAGTELVPCILPDADMRAAGMVPGDPRMVTREWCEKHDAAVLEAIDEMHGYDAPFANAGKHWIGPAPLGRAALCGWWQHGSFIQSGLGAPHDDQHHDYATTTMLVREV